MAQQQAVIEQPTAPAYRSRSDRPTVVRWTLAFLSFFKDKPLGGFGALLIILMISVAFLAPVIQRYDPNQIFETPNPAFDPAIAARAEVDPNVKLLYPPEKYTRGGIIGPAAPSAAHWFGTDKYGRDLYSQVVHGAQLSMLVGIGSALIAVISGLFFGMISAYFGGWIDMLIQRATDALLAFPALILLLLFVQVVKQPNKYYITLALGIVGISQVVRIVRSSVLTARQEQYVMAGQVIGASDTRIMIRHILPNIMAPTIVIFTISIGAYILAEASLSFIGLGDPVAISWGKMLNQGRTLVTKPWLSVIPGAAIMLAVLGFNLAGDALRDVLDPRLRGRGGNSGF